MVDRILLNSSGLKVSQPGVSVSSAAISQLQFNSDFSAIGLFTTGAFSINWSYFDSGRAGVYQTTIPFGKTYSSPPLVWFYQDTGSYLVPLGNAYGTGFAAVDNSLPGQERGWYMNFIVQTSGIAVRAWFDKQTDGWGTPFMTVRWYCFEHTI